MKILRYEIKKILIKQYALFIMLFVIISSLFSLNGALTPDQGFRTAGERARYLELMTPLTGFLTEEKEEKITAMYEELLAAEALEEELTDKFISGGLTDEELDNGLEPYKEILDDDNIISTIFEQYQYAAADKDDRMLLPVQSVPVMQGGEINYFLLLAVAFCGAFAIMAEQTSKSDLILITTPAGQKSTMAAKLAVLTLLIIFVCAVLFGIDLIKLNAQLPSEYWDHSLCSLQQYQNTDYDISIFGAFAAAWAMKPVGYVFICTLAMLTAHFSKSYIAAIFPYSAFPIVADYLAERDSQAYFIPTGLLKGYGYFFGNVCEPGYDDIFIFRGVPRGYLFGLICFTVLFITAGYALLIHLSKNRLMKNINKHKKSAAALPLAVLLLFTSCSASEPKREVYGGFSIYSSFFESCENEKYIFTIEEAVDEDKPERLCYTEKSSGITTQIPFPCFCDISLINDCCASDDYLYFLDGSSDVWRIRLSDMVYEKIFSPYSGMKKNALGLTVSFISTDLGSMISYIFTVNDELYLFLDDRIFVLDGLNSISCVIDEKIEEVAYDNDYICYVNSDRQLKAYEIKTKTTVLLSDKRVKKDTLRCDADKLYYDTSDNSCVIDKSEIKM